MKKTIVILLLIPRLILAQCDWSMIEKVEGGYLYPKECHIQVGKNLDELELREEQVARLNKTIELKDLAIDLQTQRADVWRQTTFDLEERILKKSDKSQMNTYLLIGSGVLLTVLSAWAVGQASRR